MVCRDPEMFVMKTKGTQARDDIAVIEFINLKRIPRAKVF